jgi:hypothetical protein
MKSKLNIMKKMFIVKYSFGSYEDHHVVIIFATTKKSTATKYVTKFNRILKKWKKHYSQYEQNDTGLNWIKEEYIEKYFDRWHCLRNINRCYYEEVPLR